MITRMCQLLLSNSDAFRVCFKTSFYVTLRRLFFKCHERYLEARSSDLSCGLFNAAASEPSSVKILSTSPFSIAYSSIDCCHPQKSTRLLKTASVDDSFVSSAILVPSWSSREYSYKQNCEKLRTLEKLFSPDTFELHSPSEVSDHATCLFCDQQEFDRGAERSVMLKGCYGRCEN